MSDEDFDYKIPITEQKLNSALQPDFLSPPFELLSTLQAEVQVRGMNGKMDYGCQDPMGQMAMYSMCGPCYDAGTPSTAAGTPPSAGDSDEFNDSPPGDDTANSPQQIRPRKNMNNGPSSPQNSIGMNAMMNGQMQPFIPINNFNGQQCPPGAMMVPFPGSPAGNCMPMGQQVVVYCVPVESVPWVQGGGEGNGEGVQVFSPMAADGNGSPLAAQLVPGNAFMLPASPTGGPMTGPCGMVEVPSPQMNMALQNGMSSPTACLALPDGTNNTGSN
jgi:hypothetical protein